jgi:hypothetical protein
MLLFGKAYCGVGWDCKYQNKAKLESVVVFVFLLFDTGQFFS